MRFRLNEVECTGIGRLSVMPVALVAPVVRDAVQ
jgi:hypothetical protein